MFSFPPPPCILTLCIFHSAPFSLKHQLTTGGMLKTQNKVSRPRFWEKVFLRTSLSPVREKIVWEWRYSFCASNFFPSVFRLLLGLYCSGRKEQVCWKSCTLESMRVTLHSHNWSFSLMESQPSSCRMGIMRSNFLAIVKTLAANFCTSCNL